METVKCGGDIYAIRFECGIGDFRYKKAENAFSAKALEAFADSNLYPIVFLYGPSGCGKTHLAKGIYGDWLMNHPSTTSKMITTESFIDELINSMNTKTEDTFYAEYGSLDLLILDDAFTLKGKQATQEAVYKVGKSIYDNGGKMLIIYDGELDGVKTMLQHIKYGIDNGLFVDMVLPSKECFM